jgi:hypothetical protein
LPDEAFSIFPWTVLFLCFRGLIEEESRNFGLGFVMTVMPFFALMEFVPVSPIMNNAPSLF